MTTKALFVGDRGDDQENAPCPAQNRAARKHLSGYGGPLSPSAQGLDGPLFSCLWQTQDQVHAPPALTSTLVRTVLAP